jgi:hypothetical protein
MTKRKRRKGQTMIYKTLYKKLKIESATRTPQHIGAGIGTEQIYRT